MGMLFGNAALTTHLFHFYRPSCEAEYTYKLPYPPPYHLSCSNGQLLFFSAKENLTMGQVIDN